MNLIVVKKDQSCDKHQETDWMEILRTKKNSSVAVVEPAGAVRMRAFTRYNTMVNRDRRGCHERDSLMLKKEKSMETET